MSHDEKVLQIVRQEGPVVPSQISKEIGTDSIIASAVLSDLVSQNKLKISSVKFGGSPLYYLEGQEEKLQKYAEKLQDKERQTFNLLKERKVLRDINLEPATRYALRQLKDFAKPLEVTASGNKEIFWKWYMLPTQDAAPLIKAEILRKVPLQPVQEPKEIIKTQRKEEIRPELPKLQSQNIKKEEKIEIPKPILQKEIKKEELIRPVMELIKTQIPKPEPKIELKTPVVQKKTETLIIEKKIPEQIKKPIQEPQQVLAPVAKKTKIPKIKQEGDFILRIADFFKKNNIEIVDQKIKKKTEAEFIIKVPNAVGNLQYFCKAKNKKNCNDADLSEAIVQGQLKKLPVLFLTSGNLTKEAQLLLNNDQLNISFKKV